LTDAFIFAVEYKKTYIRLTYAGNRTITCIVLAYVSKQFGNFCK